MLIRFVRFGKKVRGILNRGAFRQVEGHSMPVAQAGFATVEAERSKRWQLCMGTYYVQTKSNASYYLGYDALFWFFFSSSIPQYALGA